MESGAPKRDTPDNDDFEGEPDKGDQLPEEAPSKVTEGDREKRGEREKDD